MRKHKAGFPAAAVMAGILLCGAPGSGITAAQGAGILNASVQETQTGAEDGAAILDSGEQASAYVEQLLQGDAAMLEDAYQHTEELIAALKKAGGFAGLQKQLKILGKLKETGPVLIRQIGAYTSYSVPCRFEKQKLNIVLNVDNKGRIGGIVTAEYEEGTANNPQTSADAAEEETANNPQTSADAEGEYREISLPLQAGDLGELPGILTLPEQDGPFPAVVLVHGSGPQDMDETLLENKPFRDLAHGLADRGIAVYRYDKRTLTYAAELQGEEELTLYGETVEDAVSAAALLMEREEIDPDRVFVLGHSLGGQAIPLIAGELESAGTPAAGFIFLAAPARKMPVILREQADFIFSLSPAAEGKQSMYEQLDRLDDAASLPAGEPVFGAYPAYWRFLEEYDQVAEAEKITAPCLVLQGGEDYQVSMEDYSLWQEAFGSNELWSFHTYPGLTHIFTEGRREDAQAAYLGENSVDEQVIEDIADFIRDAF